MKIKNFLFILFVLSLSFNSIGQTDTGIEGNRKKVALVLSGGGAKGTAHIGVLKVLEQAQIPIDMIVGTSMGALIGGLYSIGYTSSMLDSLVRIQDWPFLLSDRINPKDQTLLQRNRNNTYMLSFALNGNNKFLISRSGFIKGKNLANLFSKLTLGYHNDIDFSTLPIPFVCVATDMVNFSEIDFYKGNLASTMRASMSIPAVFSPVYMDNMVLVDGGLKNNFPVDVAKQMGADIVIGVSVQNLQERTVEDFKQAGGIFNQLMDVNTEGKFYDNLAMTDIFIKVNVEGYSAASFNLQAIDTLIRRGEDAAKDSWDGLMQLKQELGLDSNYTAPRPKPYHILNQNIRMKISEVTFKNITSEDKKYLKEKFNLKRGQAITVNELEKVMTALRSNLFYNDASYKIEYRRDGYAVNIETEGKKTAEMYLGVRFDNEEKVSMQIGGTVPLQFIVPTSLNGTLRLGKRSMAKIEATFNPSSIAAFTTAYTFHHNDINVYWQGNRDFNTEYNQHQFDIGFMNYGMRNFLFDVFARWDYYRYNQVLSGQRSRKPFVSASHMYSYHARIHYDDRISKYFAQKGQKYELSYSLYTDNLYQYEKSAPLSIFAFDLKKTIPVTKRLVIEPEFYGRWIYGENIPTVLSNCIGGEYFSHFVSQQMPFAGVGNTETTDNTFAAFEINSRMRILDNNYISLAMAIGQNADKIKDLFSVSPLIGTRLSYAYNSVIGPVGASLGFSNRTKELYLYVNIGYEF